MCQNLITQVFCFGFIAGTLANISDLSLDLQDGGSRFKRQVEEGGCTLPPQPEFGTYTIAGDNLPPVPGQLSKQFSLLQYKCNPKFLLNGPNAVYCIDGKWSAEVKCLKTCPPLVSASLDFYCSLNGVQVPCTERMAVGTKSDTRCKRSYIPLALPTETISCGTDGIWETSYVICTAECGTVPTSGTPNVINGTTADIAEFPWHVAIFDKAVGDTPKHICGGSIVSPSVVISAAHCFWTGGSKTHRPKEEFAVGYGKVYNGWNDPRDAFGSYTDIKQLILNPDYFDIVTSYAQDIAIVVLRNVIEFSNIIKPVCVDWTHEGFVREITPGTLGKVAGWGWSTETGSPNEHLMQLTMPVASKEDCRALLPWDFQQYITKDKLCAGYANGSNVCRGDSGGGLCFPETKKGRTAYYLQGIVSVGPSKGLGCNSNVYTTFTTVLEFLPWLKENRVHREPAIFRCTSGENILAGSICDGVNDCTDESDELADLCSAANDSEESVLTVRPEVEVGSCIIPPAPGNGSYSFTDTEDAPIAWTPIRNGTILKYKCEDSYMLNRFNDEIVCTNGQWSETPPKCFKPCPPLIMDHTQNVYCNLDRINANCRNPMAVNSEAGVFCTFEYVRPLQLTEVIKCKEDSTWSSPLIPCHPECGTRPAVDRSLDDSLAGIVPWHASIYEKKSGSTPEHICEGSVVNANTILTAASCVWDYETGALKSNESFAVGMGKVYKPWNDPREKHAVYSDVRNILVREPYKGESYANVAILILTTRIDLNHNYVIRPICLDWTYPVSRWETINRGKFGNGIIAGWNFNLTEENDDFQITHIDIRSPTIGFDVCYYEASEAFKKVMSFDNFCAEKINEVTICRDNIGAGFASKKIDSNKELYFLQGVAFSQNRTVCNEEYTLFVDLQIHRDWLMDSKVHLGPAEG